MSKKQSTKTPLDKIQDVAVEWGMLEVLPKFKWLKVPQQEFKYFDIEQAQALLAKADAQWRPMILTALRAGLRQGELLGLRWQDVDFERRSIVVRQAIVRGQLGPTKNGLHRRVDMCEQLYDELKSFRHLKGDLVFCNAEFLPGSRASAEACEEGL